MCYTSARPLMVSQEIKFGDNDTLSAITASMIHADYLFLLTDVDSLYTANPRKDPSAKAIEVVTSIAAIRSQGVYPECKLVCGCSSASHGVAPPAFAHVLPPHLPIKA